MWILTPQQQPTAEACYLLSGKAYVVGRKNCDILLPSDQSISRAHAHLSATEQTLTLKDTSKYGTFVNNQQITTPVNLKSGDLVTFGVFQSKFSVVHLQPVVCSSCLDNDGQASLSQVVLALGGKLVSSWSQDCTHLVMSSVKVTIKTISALLCCCPIVKPEFFSELSRAVQQKLPPPKAESFIPEIDEPSLNKDDVNLGAVPLRKQLYSGRTFIFLSAKQLKRLRVAVSFGGGRSQLLEEGSLPRDLLESPQSCVVDFTTGASQTLLSPSATEWANSVKSIVERKGLRVITESEIGLAAIYASCEKYCNPSSSDSDSVPKVTPRIPSASLSQSVAVDETVLPAASQDITAYAANTETSQRMRVSEVTGVTSVGETPEKKPHQYASQLRVISLVAQKTTTQCIVDETMSSSLTTAANAESQKKKSESKLAGEDSFDIRPQPSTPKTNSGTKTFPPKKSPQKPKISSQASPQKQSTLTTFFQPASKKRHLEDEPSAVTSEPKRPALASSVTARAPHTPAMSEEIPPLTHRGPATVSQTPLGSAADLFAGRSEARSEEPQSRKRKEMEDVIQMEELESIMSEDMDCFDEQPSINQGQQAKPEHSSAKQKQVLNTAESSSKRQRVHLEKNGITNQRPQAGSEKESSLQKNSQRSEQHAVRIKTEPADPADCTTANRGSSKLEEMSSASTSKDVIPFEEDDVSFIEDLELLNADIPQPKEEIKSPLKPVVIKQEVQESKIDEDLPKKLLLVEFKSLTVAAPPKAKQNQMQGNGHIKNFKCFRKSRVPGSEGFHHIIGGSDLLVHNRGKNSDLDEWLKDAAEEEQQSRRDETIGDDLFRYNPTKLSKRR
ncbi:nibrin [Maylandia zebra]|uniref:nibrin n=1 Tax=Maylandia zebra TaxID=106582 RepID=UPI00403D4DC1